MTRSEIGEVVRFGAVGLIATGTYVLCQAVLIKGLHINILISTTISLCASISLSYLGHHHATFRARGSYGVYFQRFALTTIFLILVSNFIVYICARKLKLTEFEASLITAILYPLGSYFLNKRWVFRQSEAK